MDAIALLEDRAAVAFKRLASYRVERVRYGLKVTYRVVRFCRTGETIMGRFPSREAADTFLLTRLPKPCLTRAD